LTPEVEADLRAYGVPLPPFARRGRPNDKEPPNFVVAGFYDFTRGPYFPDNIIGRCSCGRFIQWRPHAPADLTKLCLFCASYLD
jgi:hypothetical protein